MYLNLVGTYVVSTISTADLPTTNNTLFVTFADDTAVQSCSCLDPNWLIKINKMKSARVTFTKQTPRVTMNGQVLVQIESDKYLGTHLDKRLT